MQKTSIMTDNIESLEKILDKKLPKAYKDFLLEHDGSKPGLKNTFFDHNKNPYRVRTFFSFFDRGNTNNSLVNQYNYFHGQKRIIDDTLPIGQDDGGNLFLISLRSHDYGDIYFWDHELEAEEDEEPTEKNLTFLTDSFSNFLKNLKKFDVELDPKDVISTWSDPDFKPKF